MVVASEFTGICGLIYVSYTCFNVCQDKNGFNALMVAAEHADADALCILLNEGADEMATNKYGKEIIEFIDAGLKSKCPVQNANCNTVKQGKRPLISSGKLTK